MPNALTFYEVAPTCSVRWPSDLTEHERQLFDVINNAGAIDLKLLTKRSYGGQSLLNQSLRHLQDIGAIERRTVEVA